MKIEQTKLIKTLRDLTHNAKVDMLEFKTYPMERLTDKPNENDWSILECIEHLNLYGYFYLPEIERNIMHAEPGNKLYFKSGLLGNYFVNMIKASNKKKIKATKQMDSTGSDLSLATIDQFIKQLDWLDSLLEKSQKLDLAKVKTAISLTTFVKLRLGDTLRFVVYHNERHLLQAKQMKKAHSI